MRLRMKHKKLRTVYLIALVLLLGVEIFIGDFVRDNFVRPYVGDVLVVVLIYCALRVIFPKGIKLLPLYIFIFACGVELMQFVDVVALLDIPSSSILSIIIGRTFSVADIICYAVGCTLIYTTERIIKKHP